MSTFQGNSTLPPRNLSHAAAHRSSSDDDEFFAGLSAGMGSPYDFQLPLATDASAFSPGAQDGTVSPQELFISGDSFPPSATFTELSTPSLENSGAFSYNTSPMIADDDTFGQQVWSSLFPEVPGIIPSVEESKPEVAQAAPALTRAAKVTVSKLASSPISATGASKPSTVAGITRPRKELSPIAFDPKDPVAAKRARNTEAARKSRAKKLERQMCAEARIADLEQQIADRDAVIAKLKAQLDTQKAFYQ